MQGMLKPQIFEYITITLPHFMSSVYRHLQSQSVFPVACVSYVTDPGSGCVRAGGGPDVHCWWCWVAQPPAARRGREQHLT